MVPNPIENPTLSVEEAAALYGISLKSAYAAVHSGAIPSLRMGRLIRIPTRKVLDALGIEVTDNGGPRAA